MESQRILSACEKPATQANSCQLATVQDKAKDVTAMPTGVRCPPPVEATLNQPERSSVSEGLVTSRDLLVKRVMEAKEKVRQWTSIENEAKEALRRFDQEKEKAKVGVGQAVARRERVEERGRTETAPSTKEVINS